jgi:hypothetical protein
MSFTDHWMAVFAVFVTLPVNVTLVRHLRVMVLGEIATVIGAVEGAVTVLGEVTGPCEVEAVRAPMPASTFAVPAPVAVAWMKDEERLTLTVCDAANAGTPKLRRRRTVNCPMELFLLALGFCLAVSRMIVFLLPFFHVLFVEFVCDLHCERGVVHGLRAGMQIALVRQDECVNAVTVLPSSPSRA